MGHMKRMVEEERVAARRAVRLGQLAERKVGVFCWCACCGHSEVRDSERLIRQMGPELAVADVGAWMECAACGRHQMATRPDWVALGLLRPALRHLSQIWSQEGAPPLAAA